MKRCSNCQMIVDDRATFCPSCGYSFYQSQKVTNPFFYGLLIIIVVFLISLVLYSLLASSIKMAIDNYYYNSEPFFQELVSGIKNQPEESVEESVVEVTDNAWTAEAAGETVETAAVEEFNNISSSSYNFKGSGYITYKNNTYYFRMSLRVSGNDVNGEYIVTNGDNVWVDLSGTVNNNGKAVVYEYKNGSPTSYYFDGYLNSGSFSGKYKTTSRNLVMDFYASSD